MTKAVCYRCGELKFGALCRCPECEATPSSDDDLITSLIITDSHFDQERLNMLATLIKEGTPLQFPDELRARLAATLPDLKRMLGRGPLSAPRKNKSRWWPF